MHCHNACLGALTSQHCRTPNNKFSQQEAKNPKIQSPRQELSGILTFTLTDRITIHVPESLRSIIMQEYHDSSLAGHGGWKKVLYALQQWYYWDTMAKDVKAFVQACPHCQWYKPTVQPVPPIMPKLVPQRPFSKIFLDWVSPLPVSSLQHGSLLNIIDSFTKYAIYIPVTRSITTKQLIDTVWARLFTLVGLPAKIIGDRDTRLTADAMRAQTLSSCAYSCRFLLHTGLKLTVRPSGSTVLL
jgi:hypothetical protein